MIIGSKKLILLFVFIIVINLAGIHCTKILINKLAISSFKKLYNTYSFVLQDTVDDFDGNIGCYFSTDRNQPNNFEECDKFFEKFSEKLNVTKFCKNNSLANGCLPSYKEYTTSTSCNGFSKKMMNEINQTYIMQDKTSLTIYNQLKDVPMPIFAIDTNGKLFPNKSGHDLFTFVIIKNHNENYTFHPNITYCLPQNKNGFNKLQDIYK